MSVSWYSGLAAVQQTAGVHRILMGSLILVFIPEHCAHSGNKRTTRQKGVAVQCSNGHVSAGCCCRPSSSCFLAIYSVSHAILGTDL
jgi:hypothetical protein